ncbi:unnamed protein product [Periconia digitata]|uniref:Uncharacterized protein n=1 Tax=Periconia digitata TaxID=1303443 RepID=A0A9W4XT73_9PLEO|nr:unnamed protein product [Periconia digitata]
MRSALSHILKGGVQNTHNCVQFGGSDLKLPRSSLGSTSSSGSASGSAPYGAGLGYSSSGSGPGYASSGPAAGFAPSGPTTGFTLSAMNQSTQNQIAPAAAQVNNTHFYQSGSNNLAGVQAASSQANIIPNPPSAQGQSAFHGAAGTPSSSSTVPQTASSSISPASAKKPAFSLSNCLPTFANEDALVKHLAKLWNDAKVIVCSYDETKLEQFFEAQAQAEHGFKIALKFKVNILRQLINKQLVPALALFRQYRLSEEQLVKTGWDINALRYFGNLVYSAAQWHEVFGKIAFVVQDLLRMLWRPNNIQMDIDDTCPEHWYQTIDANMQSMPRLLAQWRHNSGKFVPTENAFAKRDLEITLKHAVDCLQVLQESHPDVNPEKLWKREKLVETIFVLEQISRDMNFDYIVDDLLQTAEKLLQGYDATVDVAKQRREQYLAVFREQGREFHFLTEELAKQQEVRQEDLELIHDWFARFAETSDRLQGSLHIDEDAQGYWNVGRLDELRSYMRQMAHLSISEHYEPLMKNVEKVWKIFN